MAMSDVVRRLVAQQTRIFEILDFEERPLPRPPITTAQLQSFAEWSRTKGFALPPSYKEFLQVCNGIENFCVSYSLLGTTDLMNEQYAPLLAACLADGVGFDYREERPPLLIGCDAETTTRVWFELTHEREADDEPIVLEGDPGDMTLHASFGAFMQSRISVNDVTIVRLLQLRAQASGN